MKTHTIFFFKKNSIKKNCNEKVTSRNMNDFEIIFIGNQSFTRKNIKPSLLKILYLYQANIKLEVLILSINTSKIFMNLGVYLKYNCL